MTVWYIRETTDIELVAVGNNKLTQRKEPHYSIANPDANLI